MAEHTILLNDGSSVLLETSLSIGAMRKLQKNGTMSMRTLTAMAKGIDMNDLDKYMDSAIDSMYVAYLNHESNKEDPLEKEEFLDLVPYDMVEILQIFVEVVGGDSLGTQFADNFEKTTKKGKK